ncbi:unnamed protein product [Porites evermanni]|uniref:DNA-(apurinic or apyrimidinic site) endonuclease n=1 Tax=Porites evermanni TaxID=104178 RepID=A0ABN8SMI0_9CNID|nr:unnamed protein product [Porites evermanni]
MVEDLNYQDIKFPVSAKDYTKIEQHNENVLHLLLIAEGEKQHYVLIKDFNSLMYNKTKHKARKHFYMYCLQCVSTEEILTKHKENCLVINGESNWVNGLLGGISYIANQHGEANNKYISGYDSSKPSKYVMYLDANNLYGYAMSQSFKKCIEERDNEGRVITSEFKEFYSVVSLNVLKINVSVCIPLFSILCVPNAGRGLSRLDYRQGWDKDFRDYVKNLDKNKPIILYGDLNVAHKEIAFIFRKFAVKFYFGLSLHNFQ